MNPVVATADSRTQKLTECLENFRATFGFTDEQFAELEAQVEAEPNIRRQHIIAKGRFAYKQADAAKAKVKCKELELKLTSDLVNALEDDLKGPLTAEDRAEVTANLRAARTNLAKNQVGAAVAKRDAAEAQLNAETLAVSIIVVFKDKEKVCSLLQQLVSDTT